MTLRDIYQIKLKTINFSLGTFLLLTIMNLFFFVHLATVKLIMQWKICRDGLKEVLTKGGEEEWGKDGSMDPQEKKQVLLFLSLLFFSTLLLGQWAVVSN